MMMVNKKFNLVVVGHLTIDFFEFEEEQRKEMGGPPAYAMIAPALGMEKVGIVSHIGQDFPENYISQLTEAGLDVSGISRNNESTQFINKYTEGGKRTQEVKTIGRPIQIKDFPKHFWNTDWMHLSPVLQEVDTNIIPKVKEAGIKVSVDAQGFVRKRTSSNDHSITSCHWKEFPNVAPFIDILKADTDELCQLTQKTDFTDAAKTAYEIGVNLILITRGHHGSYLYSKKGLLEIPALPPQTIVDHTGSGDVFAISFIFEYQRTSRPIWSAFFASSSASYNVETPGPTCFPSFQRVTNRLRSFLSNPNQREYVKQILNEPGPSECPLIE